ncbi:MAG: carbohydrate-binding family 9-like protein [Phycisphaerae bacterium]|nr:carbohydrate-binding family 9-like protein [Phycisphaerae bacterium]
MSSRIFRFAPLGLILAAATGCQQQATVKVGAPYTCHQATGPITIDGKLDEPAWKDAETITTFYPLDPAKTTQTTPTVFRMLWDKQNLYVAFECTDDDVWSYSNKADDELWNGDVGEFFIKPSTQKRPYYEFVTAPNGAQYDGRYSSRGAGGFNRFKGWNAHAKIATKIDGTDGNGDDDDRGYVIEMAVPMKAFAQDGLPADGTVWTFGAFRYDYSKSFEQPLLMMSIPESKSGFHYYEGYGKLIFKGKK